MSLLKTLKLTDASRSGMIASPEARLRHKLLAKLDEQIAIAKADQAGEPFIKRGMRSVVDPETGERVRREVPVRVRRWFWIDGSNGRAYLQLRYGNRVIELAKGKPTIEIESGDKLVDTLETVRASVADGELDEALTQASQARKLNFRGAA